MRGLCRLAFVGPSFGSTVAFAISVACIAAGCSSGASHPPLLTDSVADGGALGVADGYSFGFDVVSKPLDCNAEPDGALCACLDLPLAVDAPNLYFVLDRSGSMNDLDKWSSVRRVLGEVETKLGPRANFAAAVFPSPNGDDCTTGIEVAPPRPGDSPAGVHGPTLAGLAYALRMGANGGTPTAATFDALGAHIASLHGRTFVILATDGGPNCNANAMCSAADCQINIDQVDPACPRNGPPNCCDPAAFGPLQCNDVAPTVSAIARLKALGVPTFVVGIPGSTAYADVLNQAATAGGTARPTAPYYYSVDAAGDAPLLAALSRIAAKVTATCTLSLSNAPPDPQKVNVYLDDVLVPADPANGWTLAGSVVTLTGGTCQRVLNGDVLSVHVVAGCPTVIQ